MDTVCTPGGINETPPRDISSNDFATLVIERGGTGYGTRKTLFGEQKLVLRWHQDDEDDSIFYVEIDDGLMMLGGWIEGGDYFAKIGTNGSIPGVTGTDIFFTKA